MRIHVIGSGGVGGYYCGLLARNNADVTLVCRSSKDMLAKNGLHVTDRGEEFQTSSFNLLDSIKAIEEPELILLAVKSYDLDQVAKDLRASVNRNTVIITLQNGVNSDLRLSEYLESSTVFPGLTWVLSKAVAPGVIVQKAPRTFIKFGTRDGTGSELIPEISKSLEAGGVQTEISEDIVQDLWRKFIWLANFAGMAGSRRKAIGEIVNDPAEREIWIRGVDETLAVAAAHSIPTPPGIREFIIGRLEHYQSSDTDFKPSLLVDLENNRPTEIEALSGTIIRMAQEAQLPVPIHQSFYDAIS